MEIPLKIADKWTLYPSYRFYNQTAADYFAPFEQHLSSEIYYTSDYDLSSYHANQFGFGISYTDILTSLKVGPLALESVDLKLIVIKEMAGLNASIISAGFKFVLH